MKTNLLFVYTIALILLSACNEKKVEKATNPRPVKVAEVKSRSSIDRNFSAVVEAVEYAQLAFKVNGQIVELPVVEGMKVKRGDLIARVDPRDIALQYASDKSNLETATAQMKRNEKLLGKEAISLQEFEIGLSNYQQAKSAFEMSKNNMTQTRLTAPFDGSIEERHVEQYQRITSGNPIVLLTNTNKLQVKFTIPDNNIYLLVNTNPLFKITFEAYPGKTFNGTIKEYLDASPNGSGVPVTLTITDPNFAAIQKDIKPGFSCTVNLKVELENYLEEEMTSVPLSAVFADVKTGQKKVWIIDKNNQVRERAITVSSPWGESEVSVTKGVKAGEMVVTAGIYQISEGERVRIIQ